MFANVRGMSIWSTRSVDNVVVSVNDRCAAMRAPPCGIQNGPERYALLECSSSTAPVFSVLIHLARKKHRATTRGPP